MLAHLRHRPLPPTTAEMLERGRRLGELVDPVEVLSYLEERGLVAWRAGRWHVLPDPQPLS